MNEETQNLNINPKQKLVDALKFYLIPFWRDPQFSEREFEIGKIKSKRKMLTRLLTPLTIIGFLLILFIMVLGVFPQWLTYFPLRDITYPQNWLGDDWLEPGWHDGVFHVLGTTDFGYDIHSRLIWGARTALTAGLLSNFVSLFGGVALGIIAAHFGGRVDSIMMRIFDIIMAFPSLILALIFIRMFGQNLQYILLVYGILGIPGYARFIRASAYQVKQNIYIQAAKTSGENNFRIMFWEILPNAITPVLIVLSASIGGSILGIASLSFIGLGDMQFSDWGTDINWAYAKILTKPWISIWPGLFIAITVLGFMLLGDGLRDALDPRLR